MKNKVMIALFCTLLISCVSKPEDIEPVKNFELKPYLGTWYEIARLDHSFERGMTHVTASYEMKEDGGVRVINKGFIIEDQEWKEAEGKAYFVEDENTGYLKVSFFGPFYGAYVIFELDNNYQYAFVTSNNKEYLWFLSRSPTVDQGLMGYFVRQAKLQGFDTDKLIWVEQNTD